MSCNFYYGRINFFTLFIAAFSLWLCSCAVARLDNFNYNLLYNSSLGSIHPSLYFIKTTSDSALLYVKLPAGDLLYINNNSAPEARFFIWYGIYPGLQSSQVLDSATYNFTDENKGAPQDLIVPLQIKMPQRNSFLIHVRVFDINRGKFAERNITVVAKSQQSPCNFALFANSNTQVPVFDNNVQPAQSYKLQTPQKAVRSLYMRFFKDDFPPAYVPFKTAAFTKFNYVADTTCMITQTDSLIFHQHGLYHFQYDTLVPEGFTVFFFDDDYPLINRIDQMAEPLRYITSNEEYTKLLQAADTKKAVDDFWLACAGNADRASKLVGAYYNRVRLCNTYFTSFTQGWKTDRGMIYIIFGTPDVVYKTDNSETWQYESGGNNELRFTFSKIQNPFSENDFQLVRSVSYEVAWYQAVEKWRAGRL